MKASWLDGVVTHSDGIFLTMPSWHKTAIAIVFVVLVVVVFSVLGAGTRTVPKWQGQ